MPYFSIILPIYNVEKYLVQCIESILFQNFLDYELILVDDGSTDNSGKICNEYIDRENVVVIHKKNGGISSARNVGIERACGEWCVFVDSDDYINDIEFLNNLYKNSINQDVVIYGCSVFEDETGKIIRRKYNNLERINKFYDTSKKMHYLNLTNNVSVSSWTHAIKKQYIIENNLFFDENLKACEDVEWFFRLMASNPEITAIKGYPYSYRVRKNSLSRTKKDGFWMHRYNMIKLSEKNLIQNNCNLKLKNELFNYLAYQYMILLKDIAEEKSSSEAERGYSQAKQLCYLLKYRKDVKTMGYRLIISIFGIERCSKIISFIKK